MPFEYTSALEITRNIIGLLKLKDVFDYVKKNLDSDKKTLDVDIAYFTESLSANIQKTVNWSQRLSFLDLPSKGAKQTDGTFVNLKFYSSPRLNHYTEIKPSENLLEAIPSILLDSHLVILGGPGSGKTTSMKKLSRDILLDKAHGINQSFPLILRLREFTSDLVNLSNQSITFRSDTLESSKYLGQRLYAKNILHWIIYRELGLSIKYNSDFEIFSDIHSGYIRRYISTILNELNALVVIDGFDEIPTALHNELFEEINHLCLSLSYARVIVTARIGSFGYSLDNATRIEIANFDPDMIKEFCNNWISDSEKSKEFYDTIINSPFFDVSIRPLNLSFLASLFEINGTLPLKPVSIYRDIIELLNNRWDKERSIVRGSILNFLNFDSHQRIDFLSSLAFQMTKTSETTFSSTILLNIYDKLRLEYDLPKTSFRDVLKEIEYHSGLFVQSGYDLYEFPHKCLQEYLAAVYLSQFSPLVEISEHLVNYANEIAVLLGGFSKNPGHKLKEIWDLVNSRVNAKWIQMLVIRMTEERVSFKPDPALATLILELWNRVFNETKRDDVSFVSLLSLNGIAESFSRLQEHFVLFDSRSKDLHKYKIEKVPDLLGHIIEMRKKLYDNSNFEKMYLTPSYFVKDWKYFRDKVRFTNYHLP